VATIRTYRQTEEDSEMELIPEEEPFIEAPVETILNQNKAFMDEKMNQDGEIFKSVQQRERSSPYGPNVVLIKKSHGISNDTQTLESLRLSFFTRFGYV
jgi:hypothetical protein